MYRMHSETVKEEDCTMGYAQHAKRCGIMNGREE
jgi:hypothetical protein